MLMGLCVNVSATETDDTGSDIYYSVYDECGNVVEDGFIIRNTNARYHWSPNITLGNGWYTSLFLCQDLMLFMLLPIHLCVFRIR